jgi:hypothetical protein
MMPPRLDGHVDSSGECADIRVQLGIYVFGAISPPDRATVVRHLATCPNCRDELVGLAALPGLLLRAPVVLAAYCADHWADDRADHPGASPSAGHSEGDEGY